MSPFTRKSPNYLKLPAFISFLLLLSLEVNAQLPDTSLSMDVQNETVELVLQKISRLSGFFFTYDAGIVDEKERISFEVENAPLKQVLDSVFRDPYLKYRLIDRNIVIFPGGTPPPPEKKKQTTPLYRFRGKIVDEKKKDPLPFATIVIRDTYRGTISNLRGEFSIIIPPELENPVLEISMIGYKNKNFRVDSLAEPRQILPLERDVVSLQEVIIRYREPLELINTMRNNIASLYINQDASMNGYFREYVQKNDEYLSYTEAIIEIDKSPYANFLKSDNTRLIRGRGIRNISREDSIILKIQSGVSSSLRLDIIKNLPDFLSEEAMEYYSYDFRNIVSYENQNVFHLGFRPGEGAEDLFSHEGEIFINQEDMALVAAGFKIDPADLRRNPERFLVRKSPAVRIRPQKAEYRVEYRKTEGRYHLSMVRGEVEFRLRRAGEWRSSKFRIGLEMAITEVYPGKKTRIPRRERIKRSTILSDTDFSYDPEFWGTYDIIEPESSLRDALKKLGIQWEELNGDEN